MQMVMTSGETQIQIFADCKTRHKGQQEKSRILGRYRDKETTERQKLSRRKITAKPC